MTPASIALSLLAAVTEGVAAPGTAAAGAAATVTSRPECGADNVLAGRVPQGATGVRGDLALATDGAVGPEGAQWDAPVAVTFDEPSVSLVWDLGQVRSIGAFVLQADANDTYVIAGSLDGTAGSFKPIARAGDALDRGHGLRTRALQIDPVAVRYLRVGDAQGDGFYSLSELAAYCRAPEPFPPAFRTLDAPPARVSAPDAPVLAPDGAAADRGGFALLLLAGALALGGFMALGRRWSSDEPGATAQAARPGGGGEPGSVHGAVRLMFVASGCAALVYEVVWLHLLRLVIGASALSVGIVLASFMGGMFLGSLLFSRVIERRRHPLRVYAALEIGIAVFGLLMPLVLPAARSLYVGMFGYGPLGLALRTLIAGVLLLPPTALMGATLPAIARRYGAGRRGSAALASLYAANTVGAVLGCLLAGFVLLARFDVWVATGAAASLNVLVGLGALRLSRTAPAHEPAYQAAFEPSYEPSGPAPADATREEAGTSPPPAPAATPWADGRQRFQLGAVHLAVALSGLTALGAQVVWTRLLTLLFGATVYAFAIILAVFLSGLGLGSAIAAYLLRRGTVPARALAWTQMLLVGALLLAGHLLARVLPHASPAANTPISALHGLHVLRAIDVILPAAVLWGMSFPFALAAAAAAASVAGRGGLRGARDSRTLVDGRDAGRSSGFVYAANTAGAIVGALGTSFVAIPLWGTRSAQQILVLIAALSAAALFLAVGPRAAAGRPVGVGERASGSPPGLWRGARRLALAAAAWALGAGALSAALLPGLPTAWKAHGRYVWWVDPRDQYPYVSEGAASTVAVHIAPNGYRNFHVAGRVEASNNPNDMRLQRLLGHLSALAHPRPKSVLVVGLGAGVTAGALALHPEINRIVICEIEPRVAGAAREFTHENHGVLDDPRVEVVYDDARHFLATTRERFDVITSDPIHPWVRGNSVLFSREYYAIVKERLQPQGIATQWVPLYETSEEAIRIQMRTFMAAFPDGTVWNSAASGRGYDVVLLGSGEPLRLDVGAIERRMAASPRIARALREVKIGSVIDLLATYSTSGRDMAGWLGDIPVNRDFSLKLEYISGLALNDKQADPIFAHMVAGRVYPERLFVAAPETLAELRRRIDGGIVTAATSSSPSSGR